MKSMILPSGEMVFGSEQIIPDGHFTWNEVTKNMTRIIGDISTEQRVYRAAHRMEQVRKILGGEPIIVNSWYRDVVSNARIGGAPDSRHLYGDALDFRHMLLNPKQVYSILDEWLKDGGLSAYKSHVHIDFRGIKARW